MIFKFDNFESFHGKCFLWSPVPDIVRDLEYSMEYFVEWYILQLCNINLRNCPGNYPMCDGCTESIYVPQILHGTFNLIDKH